MNETVEHLAKLNALTAAKDAIISEQRAQLAALAAERQRYERLVAELTERVRRQSATPHPLASREQSDE